MIRWGEWEVERVHHFLCGTYPFFVEPLMHEGRPIRYGPPIGFEEGSDGADPGETEKISTGWKLFCRGGYVELGPYDPAMEEWWKR